MSWVESELREQPSALASFLEAETANALGLASELALADIDYVLIAARGSSDNAARYAQYLLGTANRLPVALAAPSLTTLYGLSPRLDGALVIGISQSGAAPDVAAVLAEGRAQGRPTIAITNDPASLVATSADRTLLLHAGDERAVAATKTYVNSLAAVALLSVALADDGERLALLRNAAEWLGEQLDVSFEGAQTIDSWLEAEAGAVVARGVNYCTAFEIALKIRELAGVPFEAFSAADLEHGPIAALKPGRPVIVVAPSGPALVGMHGSIAKLRARGAGVLAISDDPSILDTADASLPLVRGVPEWLSPLTAVVPGQVAALRLATLRGGDVDRPNGLSKVTLTR